MVLEFNMGYYNIDILPKSCDLIAIVAEFGKFRYNRVPMELCASGGILQAKVDDLISDIKEVKMYINNILVFGKEIFTQHIYQLRVIFDWMCAAGLKFNAPKYILN